ncbi:MAG: nuclear transport factor 2 family protein [Actinomycetota bacterium]
MSEENVETVRRLYGLWPDRDFSSAEEVVHPDAVFDVSRNVFNPGVYRGIDGFLRFIEQVDEMWGNFQFEPEELIDAGDNVVAAIRISGKGRESGVEVEMQLFVIWTFREGKVLRYTGGYRDRSEALEAAGLQE